MTAAYKIVLVLCFSSIFLSCKMNDKNAEKNVERKERPKGPPPIEEIFKQMDSNKDGKLSKDEVKGPLSDEFSDIDIDGNGFLSKEEIAKAPRPKRPGKREH